MSSPTSLSRQVQLLLFYVVLTLLGLSPTAVGYSFRFTTWPTQCGPLSLALTGGHGTPPYRLLLVPLNDFDGRRVIEYTFSDETNATLAHLPYPENTQFVATLSDASGVGSGGTSVSLKVVATGDLSCLSPPQPPPDFLFSVDSPPRQCGPTKFSWNASAVQPPLTFYGIIPGGQSFAVPVPTEQVSAGTFTWISTVLKGSTVMFTAGDARGRANGGRSELFALTGPPPGQPPPPLPEGVPPGPNGGPPDYCLTNGGYSTTTGNPAGGIYPTGSGMPTPTPSNTSITSPQPPVGVLVGGVVGGVGGLFILGVVGLLLYRKRNFTNRVLAAKRRSATVDLDEKVLEPDSPIGDHLVARPLSNHLEPGEVAAVIANGHPLVNGAAVANGGPVVNGGPVAGGGMGVAASRKQRLSLGAVTPRPVVYPDTPSPPLTPTIRFADASSAGPSILPSPAESEAGDTRSSQTTRPNSAGTDSSPARSRRKSAAATSVMPGAVVVGPTLLRSVTYIQHDDAGSVSHAHVSDEPEVHRVIELPPSYVERRRSERSDGGGSGGTPRSDDDGIRTTRTSPTHDRPPSALDGQNDPRAMSSVSDDRFHSFEDERPTFPAASPAPAPTTSEGESR